VFRNRLSPVGSSEAGSYVVRVLWESATFEARRPNLRGAPDEHLHHSGGLERAVDTFFNDPTKCAGLWLPATRPAVDDRPQAHGGIVHPTLLAARRPTIGGVIKADLQTVRDAMVVTLGEALVSILDADGTYAVTVNGATYTVTVRFEVSGQMSGALQKSYLFGLVAGDASVAVT
jgi:hypothetical protein